MEPIAVNGVAEESQTKTVDKQQQLRDAVLKFVEHINDSSVKRQKSNVSTLITSLKNVEPLPDVVLRGIIRSSLTACFTRFTEPASFHITLSLIESLSDNNPPDALVKHLSESFTHIFVPNRTAITKWSSHTSAIAVKWLLMFAEKHRFEEKSDLINSFIVGLASLAFYNVFEKKNVRYVRCRYKELFNRFALKTFVDSIDRHYNTASVSLESAECLVALLCLLPLNECREDAIELFLKIVLKSILMAKQRSSAHILRACSELIEQLNVNQIKDELLPNAKKAMLRSPEVAIFAYSDILRYVKVDLSAFAVDIYKTIAGSLVSTDDDVRSCASKAVIFLARNVSDTTALQSLIKAIFATYSGSDGKITTSLQRIGVLETLKGVSAHNVYGKENADILGNEVLSHLIPLIPPEVHDATLTAMWDALVVWAERMSSISTQILPLFKAPHKTNTSRFATIKAMLSLFSKCGYDMFDDAMVKIIETVRKSQTVSAGEWIGASLLLLNCNNDDIRHKLMNSIVSDEFIHKDKFVTSLKKSDALLLPQLAAKLITDRPYSNTGESEYAPSALRCLFMALLWHEYEVRKYALSHLKKIITAEGVRFTATFVQHFYEYIILGDADQIHHKTYSAPSTASAQTESDHKEIESGVSGKWIMDTLRVLLIQFNAKNEKQETIFMLITSTLLVCSIPSVVETAGLEWMRWFRNIENRSSIFDENSEMIDRCVDKVLNTQNSCVRDNAIRLLMSSNELAHVYFFI
ncbi:unnamed protein product [Anisakis simplex]|uniref:TOG domain-containing protein n=1 Tax=Anisakis simplex TaxID=6269 RepID=A0A0M3K470_ANISI|nr:unnamed protein product [Anisakis simplex]